MNHFVQLLTQYVLFQFSYTAYSSSYHVSIPTWNVIASICTHATLWRIWVCRCALTLFTHLPWKMDWSAVKNQWLAFTFPIHHRPLIVCYMFHASILLGLTAGRYTSTQVACLIPKYTIDTGVLGLYGPWTAAENKILWKLGFITFWN